MPRRCTRSWTRASGPSRGHTVEGAVADWLAEGLPGRAAKTVEVYADALRPVLAVMGRIPLRDLTVQDVRTALATMAVTHSAPTLQKAHKCLTREYGVRPFGKFAATGVSAAGRLATLARIIDPKRQFRVEWDLRHLIWIPDAISRAFSSGRSVVALIAGLESAVLWWNILVRRWAHLLPRRFLRRPSARVPAGAAGPAQAGLLLRSGAECQVTIGG